MMRIAHSAGLFASALLLGCARTHHVAPVRTFGDFSSHRATAVAWSRDDKLIACGEGTGDVTVWDVATGAVIGKTSGYERHQADYEPTGLAFSPDGLCLAFGTRDGVVRLWDFRTGETRDLKGQPRELLAAVFSSDGRQLATASGGLGYPREPGPATRPILGMPAKPRVATVIEPVTVIVFDVDSGAIMSQVDASGLLNIAFSPDAMLFAGIKLAVSEATTWPIRMDAIKTKSDEVQICKVETGTVLRRIPTDGWWVYFSPDGTLLRAGFSVWNIQTGHKICDLPQEMAATFLNDGKSVLLVEQGPSPFSWWPAAIAPTTTRLVRLRLADGSRMNLGLYAPLDLGRALERQEFVSHDRALAVDLRMRMWRVPR